MHFGGKTFSRAKELGILDLWFEPVYEDLEKILYFGDVKFIIKGDYAETEYGNVYKSDVKIALDYIQHPPKLAGFGLVVYDKEKIKHPISHSFGFGCRKGTLEELKEIYKAFK